MKCVSLLALALVCSSTFAQDVSDAPKADPPIRDSVPLGSDPEVTLRKAKPESLKARTRRARQEFNDSVAQLDAGAAQASLDILTELVPLDAETAAAASYNKGCSQMAVIPPTPPSDGSKPPQEDPAQRALARQAIEQAHRAFRDAAIADSSNRDARINAERTHKLLKQMDEEDEEEKKEQQEKEEQEKDGEPKDGEPKDGEPKDGEPKDGEPKDGEPKDGEPKDGEPKDSEPKDSEPKDSEPKDSEPKDSSPPPKGTLKAEQEQKPQTAKEQLAKARKEGKLTEDEADRILQAVRDREKQRSQRDQQRQMPSQNRSGKDW